MIRNIRILEALDNRVWTVLKFCYLFCVKIIGLPQKFRIYFNDLIMPQKRTYS